jgi:hypothetical protein
MNQREAIERCRRQDTVKVKVAAAALGIGERTAYKRIRRDGCIADGVPCIQVTERCWIVPSAAVLRVLQLQDFAVGTSLPAVVPPAVKTGEGGPATAALAQRPIHLQLEGSSSGNNGSRSPRT